MSDRRILSDRAANIWSSFQRNVDPLARGAQIVPAPDLEADGIGGLASAKEEILTYAYARTRPEVYGRWGTFPPSAMLLIGRRGSGKSLLAEFLAARTETAFVQVDVPRMVLDVIHGASKIGELVQGWSAALEEMPPVTIFFSELEFTRAHEMGKRAAELPTEHPEGAAAPAAARAAHRPDGVAPERSPRDPRQDRRPGGGLRPAHARDERRRPPVDGARPAR